MDLIDNARGSNLSLLLEVSAHDHDHTVTAGNIHRNKSGFNLHALTKRCERLLRAGHAASTTLWYSLNPPLHAGLPSSWQERRW
jgi:hypothetical protein